MIDQLFKVICFAGVMFLAIDSANATQTLSVTCCSYHFNRDNNYNETNLGLMYTVDYRKDEYVILGRYKNSEYANSNLFGFGYRWKLSEDFSTAVSFGLVTGYKRGTSPFIAPSITYKNSVTVMGVPFNEGVLALSFVVARW